MKTLVFTIQDKKSAAHLPPFYCVNRDVALRHFKNAANDKQTEIGRNPEDFNLYLIGEFDDNTGVITAIPSDLICTALSLKE